MNIVGVDHIAINTFEYDKSVRFYRDILKLKQLQTVDCSDFNISYFELPGGARLELFDYHNKNKVIDRNESDTGLRHVAFKVVDVAAHENKLREAGVEIILSTCELENLSSRVLLFLDPNGVVIEFCEQL